ncbi:MAG: PQQ-binding-like beta-propeller repeat protein [Opitutales bacterium]|jgi:outer membrane protein assembly factor BamB|nr:PQQ-binding-like beta-propeller repeat protein [Opitutales bacterium]
MHSLKRPTIYVFSLLLSVCLQAADPSQNWPMFRGPGATGVSEGYTLPTNWNADAEQGEVEGVLWRSEVPGLGHSSPVVWGDRIFLCTAVSDADPELMLGRGGRPTAADDERTHSWLVLCYDKKSGKELWRKTAWKGTPRATRHVKATQANTTVAVDGENVVAFFGSEGLHCYDLDGNLKWTKDLGVINISKYSIGWGYASSPAIHKNHIVLTCDDPANPFLVALKLSDGEELWRVPRKEISERSWGTPLIHEDGDTTQVVINGWPWVISYDLFTGEELWKIHDGGDNPIPTPFIANDWIYVVSAHGGKAPVYVVKPEARGDITPSKQGPTSPDMVWSVLKGGSYMSTPVVYGDYIYLGNYGTIRCLNAKTGEEVFVEKLPPKASIIASLVASDGKIYCASEGGSVHVLEAGPEFNLLASNPMGEPLFATPAISEGALYFRTTNSLVAVR